MESVFIIKIGEINMIENNSLSGAMLGVALSNAMNDQVFRQVLGFKLLQDEERGNDGVGMALLMSNTSPAINTMIQPPTFHRNNY